MDNDNLTTDALPSPPREDKEPSNKQNENSNYQKPSNMKYKKKKSAPHAVANVINISNANGIHIGSNYTINVGNSQQTPEKSDIIKTEAINKLLESELVTTQHHITFVSEHIGKNWKMVCRTLQYSDGQIFQYYDQHNGLGIKEVVYQILLDWIQHRSKTATLGLLCSALWKASEKDVVKRMSEEL